MTTAPPTAAPTQAALSTETPLPPTASATQEPTASLQGFLLQDVGFNTPESVLYDPSADLYLVSNINGQPAGPDGNGFISQVSPQGEIIALKWIDGEAEGITLDAPKGMTLAGDALYVADIKVLRVFDRDSGAPLEEIVIPGATFLNDLAACRRGLSF